MDSYSTERYYSELYSTVQRGGVQGWGNSLADKALERYWTRSDARRILEVGSSSGQHLAWSASRDHDLYVCLDIEPHASRVSSGHSKVVAAFPHLCFVQADVQFLPFPGNSFDRVVSTCLLHHLPNVEGALREVRRVLRPGAEFGVVFPTDPGMVNRAIKRVVTYPSMRRLGVSNPRLLYAREHPNQVASIIELLREVFRHDVYRLRYHPLPLPTWNINLYVTFHALKV